MLKIESFDKPEPEKTPTLILNTLILNTRIREDGTFEVFACDLKGERLFEGTLWKLRPDGRQVCCSGISPNLGLDLDGHKICNV